MLFAGFMAYVRAWHGEKYAMTFGGGAIDNPGRYLVLLPPINGATAFSGTPYFTENPGDPFKAWDTQLTFDYMPSQYVTFRARVHLPPRERAVLQRRRRRHAARRQPGRARLADHRCAGNVTWSPTSSQDEPRMTLALLVKM